LACNWQSRPEADAFLRRFSTTVSLPRYKHAAAAIRRHSNLELPASVLRDPALVDVNYPDRRAAGDNYPGRWKRGMNVVGY